MSAAKLPRRTDSWQRIADKETKRRDAGLRRLYGQKRLQKHNSPAYLFTAVATIVKCFHQGISRTQCNTYSGFMTASISCVETSLAAAQRPSSAPSAHGRPGDYQHTPFGTMRFSVKCRPISAVPPLVDELTRDFPLPGIAFPVYHSPSMPTDNRTVLDARAMDRTLRRMADDIIELYDGTDGMVIVGIQRRGVQLAARISRIIEDSEGVAVPQGALDITLYRDDLQTVGPRPVVGPTDLPWNLEHKHVVLVDDVLYTGRTVRAALDELADFGRPARIALAVLVDRGGRELPIHADVVGKKLDVQAGGRVDVLVKELDGRDAVVLVGQEPPQ